MYILGKVNKLRGDTVTFYTRNSKRNFKNGYLTAHGRFSVNKNSRNLNVPGVSPTLRVRESRPRATLNIDDYCNLAAWDRIMIQETVSDTTK